MAQPINKSGITRSPAGRFRPVQRWSRGEPVSASKLNQIVDALNRINGGVRPPEQTRVFTGGGGGGSGSAVDAKIRGQIRFFSE
jgi:hypothetical protein